MPEVTIKVFQSVDQHRELIRTLQVQIESAKALTGSRALKVLRGYFPELGYIHSLIPSDEGWYYTRAIEPKPNCSFHFMWEHYYVSPSP